MEIRFDSEALDAIKKAGVKSKVFESIDNYRHSEVDSRLILPGDFELIRKVLRSPKFAEKGESRKVVRQLDTIEEPFKRRRREANRPVGDSL